MAFRFQGRAVGQDPEGYYYPRWDIATPISVVADTRQEATAKAFEMLGVHPRFGREGNSARPASSGWALVWDSIEEEA